MTEDAPRTLIIAVDLGAPNQDRTGWVVAGLRHGHWVLLESGTGSVPPEKYSTVMIVEDVEIHAPMPPLEIEAIKAGDDTIRGDRIGGPPPHTLKSYNRRRSGR